LRWTDNNKKLKKTSVYIYDFNQEKIKEFYSHEKLIRFLSLSPGKDLIAFVEYEDYYHPVSMKILTKDAKSIHEINKKVQHYSWSPSGDKIVFMSGETLLENYVPYKSEGVSIFDINSSKSTKVIESGWGILNCNSWKKHDKKIYFWDGKKIARYNTITKQVEIPDMESAFLSPDGRYYHYWIDSEDPIAWDPPYWSPFRIYDTKLDLDLNFSIISFISERNPSNIIWTNDCKKIIFTGNKERNSSERHNFIYDIEKIKLLKEFSGKICGINYKRTSLVVYRNNKFVIEKISIN
jgi:Tol biopolymer transport system component